MMKYNELIKILKEKVTDDMFEALVMNKIFYSLIFKVLACDTSFDNLKIYTIQEHLKNDGDFLMYTCMKCNNTNVKKFNFVRPFCYAIVEKESNNMIGYIAMIWDKFEHDISRITRLEYYIFKPYRNNGYAKEAVLAFLDRAFSGKLLELVETNYSRVYKNRKAKIELVRAHIRTDNTPSRCLVESCGFVHTGTLRRDFVVEDKYCVDKEIYEITKEEFYNNQ